MKTIHGPSLHLAQFASDRAPFNNLPSIAEWAAGMGCWPRAARLTATN